MYLISVRRIFILFIFAILIYSCSDKNKSNTTYTIIVDHYSSELEETVLKTLSVQDYSPCTNLSTSTYDSRLIRYDLDGRNEMDFINKPIIEKLFATRLSPETHTKRINNFSFPKFLKEDHNQNADVSRLETFLNSFDPNSSRIIGLNSLGIEYKDLDLNQAIGHFQNIFDLKDALSDYICNEINEKNVIILLNLFNDTSLEDCLTRCETLPEKTVCADDGNTYRNIECMKCYENLSEISCDQSVPVFKKELLTEKAFEIFYQFAEAQVLIANNKTAPIARDLIDNTMRLFNTDNNKVEILNLGPKKPIVFSTKAYLNRLLNRPFDQVSIEWDQDWSVVSDWTDAGEEIPESQMTAKGKQVFRGYRKNLVAYSDAIDKNVNFQAKLVETIDADGNEVLEWKVFIGDITIASQPSSLD